MARLERERLREERRREREREHRLENRGAAAKARDAQKAGGPRQFARSLTRDISERIALGEQVQRTGESLYDQRLFNQSAGLDSGFGEDDEYNLYDKRLFGDERETALYRAPSRQDEELYGEAQSLEAIVNTDRFRPHKDFQGVDREVRQERTGPVQYEREKDEEEQFGLLDSVSLHPLFSALMHAVYARKGGKIC